MALVWAAPKGGSSCDVVTDTIFSAPPSPLLGIPTVSLPAELHQHVEENFHPNSKLVPPAPPPVTKSGFVGTNKKIPPYSIVDRGWASAAAYPSAPIITAASQTTTPDEPSKQRRKRPREVSHGERGPKRRKMQKEQFKIRAWVPEDGQTTALRCGGCRPIRR